jgi:4-oxalocrotonate tautomerase
MPLIRISLLKGKPASYRRKVGDAVHQALVETIDVPAKDRFQLITEHDPEDFIYDREYLGIARSRDLVIIQITMSAGRSLHLKRSLFRTIAERLAAAVQLRPEDVWINLVETAKENWSFGNGIAQYA